MEPRLHRQAERLYEVFAALVRGYQFRDRDGIGCHGISVSQCHTLEALGGFGPMTMGQMAAYLHLEKSSMTRIIDHLVMEKLATRLKSANDRRVCVVRITRKGRSLVSRIRDSLVKEQEAVLRSVPAASREAVISAMTHLLSAFKERQCGVSDRKFSQRGSS